MGGVTKIGEKFLFQDLFRGYMTFLNYNLKNKKGGKKQSFALLAKNYKYIVYSGRLPPFFIYSTHLNLPNNHSLSILTVTNNKKIIIFKINP